MRFQLLPYVSLLVISLTLLGCGTNAPNPKPNEVNHGKEPAHAHPSEGPHHGHLIELGKEEYHAELTHDDATHTVTVYLLDGAAKKSVPIEEKELTLNMVVDGKPSQFKLAAMPEDSDPEGQASRFSLSDEGLLEAVESEKATGRLTVKIKGKSYSGNVEHQEHDDDGHKK
jgi:hypothetical protein